MKVNTVVLLLGAVLIGILGFSFGQLSAMSTRVDKLEKQLSGNTPAVAGAQAPAPTGGTAPTGAPTPPPAPTKVQPQLTDTTPMQGNANAKVVLVEYADFQCPFCGKFFKEAFSQIKKDYIDSGKVKFYYKNLAFLGKESVDSANAAFCAREQGKFWDYHDYLFTHQQGENQGAFSVDNLKKFAADMGLNTASFNDCLDKQKYNAEIQADLADATKNGFNSTPSFAIGNTPLVGAQPYAQFKTALDAELAKK